MGKRHPSNRIGRRRTHRVVPGMRLLPKMRSVLEPQNARLSKQNTSTLSAIVSDSAEYPVSPRLANDARPAWAEHTNRGRLEAGALWKRSRHGGVIEILRVIEGDSGMTFVACGLETGVRRRLSYGTLVREYRPVR
jgi:hypothetical protein